MFKDRGLPRPSVRLSKIVVVVNWVFPVLVTTMVYSIISPTPLRPSPLTSLTVAVFAMVTEDCLLISITVGSSSVLPSLSIPSSEVSVTSEVPSAETKTWFINVPSFTSSCVMVWVNSYSAFPPGTISVDSPGIITYDPSLAIQLSVVEPLVVCLTPVQCH